MNVYLTNPGINCIKHRQDNVGFQARHRYKHPDLGEQIVDRVQDTARFVQKRALPIGVATLTTATLGGGYAAYRAGLLPEMNLPLQTPTELKEGISARQVKSSASAGSSPVLIGAAGGRHIPIESAKQEDLVYVSEVNIPARNNDIQIHEDSVKPLQQMIADAQSQGVDLVVVSGYRSPERQQEIFQSKGQACEVRSEVSALSGTSTHQFNGIDLGSRNNYGMDVEDDFNGTREANWIRNNAPKYGFTLPYAGDTPFNRAGVDREDWHINHIQTPEEQRVLDPVIDTLNGKTEFVNIGCDSSRIYTPQDRSVSQQTTSAAIALPGG